MSHTREVRGGSVLMASAGRRLALAMLLVAFIWLAVWWAMEAQA